MSVEPPFMQPRPPAVPPTIRYAAVLPVAKPTWPLAIGVVGIVLGGGGILMNLFTILSYTVLASAFGALQPAPHLMEEMKVSGVLTSLLNVVISALLLIVGIGLAQRRRWSVPLVRVWAVARIIGVMISVVFAVVLQTRQFAALPAQPAMPFGPAKMGNVVVFMSMVVGLVWGWALPVFVLIWFNRVKVRQQTEGWK